MRILISLFFMILTLNARALVHVFGDSHSFSYQTTNRTDLLDLALPPVAVHWLGSITMHRVGRDGINFINLMQFNVAEHDTVVFVFGEIDVRCHIGRIKDRDNRPIEELINELVQKYIATILANKALYTHLTVVVSGVVPPTDHIFNPHVPYYGTIEERVHVTKQLNAVLKKQCSENDLGFIDAYTQYAETNGQLKLELSENVHIEKLYNKPLLVQLANIMSLDKK